MEVIGTKTVQCDRPSGITVFSKINTGAWNSFITFYLCQNVTK